MTGFDRAIRVENAQLWYGKGETGTHALRGVSLVAQPGEVLMVRGPSGSGKTTLLQLMGALKVPDKGRVTICGETTEGASSAELRRLRLKRIGFVFQFFNLFPTLTAWENVAIPLDIRGVDRRTAERQARDLLAEVGLADRAHHKPGQLSGGQRQRVAVARALMNEPDVILADEPTAALDGVTGALVVEAFRRLAREQDRVVVLVSHDQRVENLVDRSITIEDGLVVSEAGPVHAASSGLSRSLR
ncbi:putative ABC transport system ATP-binding protein [Rhizobium sp. RU20A]|uniref:ABC transporter ATP-binding protein n=1 Tax=Rhizobium sp. RU20A TaxID=1907412 RepID=UPI000955DF29|nr:ABC transporter ATP-binding protein [Rhizobium sp. RU20A]SIR31955.1 putative ABC transport system ATP-binding protein [Rhizobium sp. RU20A]